MHPHYTPDLIPTKRCSKCKEWQPATTEYFSLCKTRLDGFNAQCKMCGRAYYVANKERIIAKARAYYAANGDHKREYQRAYRVADKTEIAKRKHALPAPDLERIAELYRKYRGASKERRAAYRRKYTAANKEKFRDLSSRRRAVKLAAAGHHTTADVKRQYQNQKGKCYYCHVKVGDTYQVDHVIPLARGGSDGPENIVIACPKCNQSKWSKLPHEWPQGNRLL